MRPNSPWLCGPLLAALTGAFIASGQAPLGWWFISLPALFLLLRMIARARDSRTALLLGWFGGAGYFAAALFWIVEPFFIEPDRYGWMAPFALLFMAFGMALFWALAAVSGHALGRGPASRSAALVVTFAGVELLRGYVLTGFPWALIGHVWIDTPVAQIAAFVGPVGLTWLTLAIAALPIALPRAGLLGGAAAVALLWGFGIWRLAQPVAEPAQPVIIRLVQPNIPQSMKWEPELVGLHFRRLLDLTASPASPSPDLVIWPETAIPWLLNDAGDLLPAINEAAGGVPVALGVQRAEGARYFNSLVVLDGSGQIAQTYDKHHLVPFGEYIPGGDIVARLGLRGFAARDGDGYSAGPGPMLVDLPGGRALPLICYEAVFPQDLRGTARPDWLVQITNDAWFGNLSGPQQHFAQARLRAIEQGLPLLRAANTGISGVIDAKGRILHALPLGAEGVIDAALPAALPPTPYSRTGDLPVLLLLLGAGICLTLRRFWR